MALRKRENVLFSSFFQKSCLKVLSIQKVVVPLHSLSESVRDCRSGEAFVPAFLRRRRSSLTDCEQATETQHPPLPQRVEGRKQEAEVIPLAYRQEKMNGQ